MNLIEWIQLIGIIISTLGGVISAVGVVIVLPWWLRGKFAAQEKQIIEMDRKLTGEILEGDRKLSGEISEMDRKLTEEISEMDRKLTEEISEGDRKLTGEISRINKRMDVFNKRMDVFTEVVGIISKVNETVVAVLSEAKLILPDQQTRLYGHQSQVYQNILGIMVNWAGEKSNPLTREEVNRLRKYIDMMLAAKRFPLDEAKDFRAIVQKLEKEPGVPGAGLGVLIGLSILVLGTSYSFEREEEEEAAKLDKSSTAVPAVNMTTGETPGLHSKK
ncbi:MAG: hypothetical protein QME81_04030 [bacterium]|nr:hypothetical protein [bacterium]